MSDEDDNVIHLPTDFIRSAVESGAGVDFPRTECVHPRIRVDMSTRRVLCLREDCKAELDPLETLRLLAAARRGDLAWREMHKRDLERDRKEAELLKKERAKLRRELRDARGADAVEQFKVGLLDRIARGVDAALAYNAVEARESERERFPDGIWRGTPKDAAGDDLGQMLEQLHAARWIAILLAPEHRDDPFGEKPYVGEQPERARFRQKIDRAIEELEARRRRLKIQVVKKR